MKGHADPSASDAHAATSEAGARAFMPGHSREERGATGALLAANSSHCSANGSARANHSLVLGARPETATEAANCSCYSSVEISNETGSLAFATALLFASALVWHLLFCKQKDVDITSRY